MRASYVVRLAMGSSCGGAGVAAVWNFRCKRRVPARSLPNGRHHRRTSTARLADGHSPTLRRSAENFVANQAAPASAGAPSARSGSHLPPKTPGGGWVTDGSSPSDEHRLRPAGAPSPRPPPPRSSRRRGRTSSRRQPAVCRAGVYTLSHAVCGGGSGEVASPGDGPTPAALLPPTPPRLRLSTVSRPFARAFATFRSSRTFALPLLPYFSVTPSALTVTSALPFTSARSTSPRDGAPPAPPWTAPDPAGTPAVSPTPMRLLHRQDAEQRLVLLDVRARRVAPRSSAARARSSTPSSWRTRRFTYSAVPSAVCTLKPCRK